MVWVSIWKVVLVVSLALFAMLTIITTLLGAADIRRLFRRLNDEHDTPDR